LQGDQREQLGRLGGALDSIREAKAAWVLGVRHVATEEEQAWIKAARPVLVREDLKTAEPAVRQRALEHRPRVGRTV
jgi:urease accessory protein UreE